MTKSRFLFFIASTLLVLPILAGSLLGAAVEDTSTAGGDSLYKFLSVFTETLSLVDQTYVEETDQDKLMAAALDGVTDALDPLAVYVPREVVPTYLETRSVGEAHSGLYLLRERGMVYVLAVRAGSPGAAAGIEEGDLIAEIGGQSTRVMPLWKVHQLLAGEPGTKLDLELIRFAENMDVTVTLGAFPEPAPALAFHDDVPVLTFPVIDEDTPGAVRAMLDGDLAEADRLLIDLRGVAGGDAEAAYRLAGLFAGGELGHLRHRDETLETYTGDGPVWSGRIAVLTDRATLGPAEVLASVLRQKAGAELVGERTYGFAGRQSMFELGSGGVLFLADAFYTGPDAVVLDEPLEPDVQVDHRPRAFAPQDEEGESKEEPDVILDKGLELLRTPVAEKAAA